MVPVVVVVVPVVVVVVGGGWWRESRGWPLVESPLGKTIADELFGHQTKGNSLNIKQTSLLDLVPWPLGQTSNFKYTFDDCHTSLANVSF